jgi:hypothetical protein
VWWRRSLDVFFLRRRRRRRGRSRIVDVYFLMRRDNMLFGQLPKRLVITCVDSDRGVSIYF